MKTVVVSLVLLFIMAAYLIIPVVPVIDYLINKDYIAKNLCINKDKPKSCCKGKCHMIKELKKTNTTSEGENKTQGKKTQSKELNEFLIIASAKSSLFYNDFRYFILKSSHFHSLALAAIFVPPKQDMHPLI
jgi:hypothetical protein